jgi:hypothetical protein
MSIHERAFADCAGLTNVTIGKGVSNIGSGAFSGCTQLARVYFKGDAPVDSGSFQESPATIYYLPGTQIWGPTFSGRPTAYWIRGHPTILNFGGRFGPSPSGFSFVVSWAPNVSIVLEASPDLGGTGWEAVSTNRLTEGWVQITDPEWKGQPARFYRVRGE